MKRTNSGDLSPNPSPTSSNNGATNNRNQNQQQQADANRQRIPAIQAPTANDPVPQNPWLAFDLYEELLDWGEFMQMLPHTPPAIAPQNTEGEPVSAMREDKSSVDSPWFKTPEFDDYYHYTRMNSAGKTKESVTRILIPAIPRLFEICESGREIKTLEIFFDYMETIENPEEVLKMLTEFFISKVCPQSIEFNFQSYELSLDAKFLNAVFGNERIRDLKINLPKVVTINPHELDSITETLKRNTTLKNLQLYFGRNPSAGLALIECLSENSSLESLATQLSSEPGFGHSLSTLLKFNKTLKNLKLTDFDYAEENELDEFAAALEGMASNNTVEVLEIRQEVYSDAWTITEKMLKPLIQNHGLKTLILPDAEPLSGKAVKAVVDLIQHHPTLTSIHAGQVPDQETHRSAFLKGLKSNTRIQHFCVSMKNFTVLDEEGESGWPDFSPDFFKKLGEFSGLTSVNLKYIPIDDHLIEFIKTHPKIQNFKITINRLENQTLQKKLLDLVESSNQFIQIDLSDFEAITNEDDEFFEKLDRALAIAHEVSSEPKIAEASEAMKALLDKKSTADEELPFVPLDVTMELTRAIARHVPPAKAKAIFDELILHAEKRH